MESMNNSSSKPSQDSNLSTFRKRNRILILASFFFILSLTLILAALITSLYEPPQKVYDAVNAFCDVAEDTPSCLAALTPIAAVKSRTDDPNKIFTLSLQTADERIRRLIPVLSNVGSCSDSLRVGLGRIRAALAAMRAAPFVERQGEEWRAAMTEKIEGATENLESCLDELGKSGDVRAEVREVKVYVSSSGSYLVEYRRVLSRFNIRVISVDAGYGYGGMAVVWIMCMSGLPLLFIFCLFWSLFRLR